MDGFLQNLLKKLNGNKEAINANIEALGMIPRTPNILAGAQNEMQNNLKPDALSVKLRRGKGSIPLGKLKSGKTLYSDGTIKEDRGIISPEGEQTGFGDLQIPNYESDEGQTMEQIGMPETPTEELSQKMVTPRVDDAMEETAGAAPAVDKSPYQIFIEEAGKIPSVLRQELDAYMSQEDEQVQRAEEQAYEGQYVAPGQESVQARTPIRYSLGRIKSGPQVRGLPNVRTTSYDELLGPDFEEEGF